MRRGLCSLLAAVALAAPARAQFSELASHAGRVDFLTSGASLTDAQGLLNGANCLEPQASLVIPPLPSGARPALRAAYLFWGGSLVGNDQDYSGSAPLFDTRDITTQAQYEAALSGANSVPSRARAAADTTVDLLLPDGGSLAVTADLDGLFVSTYFKGTAAPCGAEAATGSAINECGVMAFFMARADITAALLAAGGPLAGQYTVAGLRADVCNGREAVCGGPDSCGGLSAVHTNGNASAVLMLVLEDPAWRLRRVVLFEGLAGLSDAAVDLSLQGIAISDPPVGSLAYWVLEGDATISAVGEEYVTVDGGSQLMTLVDDDNPLGNPFNGTINTVQLDPPLPLCASLGLGDGLCGVAGVDLDLFDIRPALAVDATRLDLRVSTGADRIVLGGVYVSVGVFAPVLDLDSRLLLLDDAGSDAHPAGAPLRYVAALSNTGNLPAADARLSIQLPSTVAGFTVEAIPPGSQDLSTHSGGAGGAGVLEVRGIAVDTGKIADVRFSLTPGCNARTAPFTFAAEVTYEAGRFTLAAPAVRVVDDLAGACPPLGPGPGQRPFWQELGMLLEGGGGCDASGARGRRAGALGGLGALVGALFLAARWLRRRGAR